MVSKKKGLGNGHRQLRLESGRRLLPYFVRSLDPQNRLSLGYVSGKHLPSSDFHARRTATNSSRRVGAFLILFLLVVANLTMATRLPPSSAPLPFKGFFKPFTQRAYLLTVSSAFLYFLGLFLPINYIEAQASQLGMAPDLARYLIPILNAAR